MRNTNEEDRYSNESNTKSQDKDTMVNKESNTKSRDKDTTINRRTDKSTMEISKIEIDRNELNNSKRVKRSMLPKKTLKYQIIVIF